MTFMVAATEELAWQLEFVEFRISTKPGKADFVDCADKLEVNFVLWGVWAVLLEEDEANPLPPDVDLGRAALDGVPTEMTTVFPDSGSTTTVFGAAKTVWVLNAEPQGSTY